MNKIMVGIIGPEVSKNLAAKAVEVAKKCGSSITFITVVDDRYSKMDMPYSDGEITQEEFRRSQELIVNEMMKKSGRMLDSIIKDYKDAEIKMDKIVARGLAYEEIVKTAEQGNYDLILVGFRSMTHHIFLGSVAKRVIEEAHCTVMVVK